MSGCGSGAYANNKNSRLFFVVIIRSMSDFYDYANITKVVNMNSYQSLLIFTRNMEVCLNPEGNPFHLNFNSKMLVKCQDFPIIREWYSLYPHETKMFDFLIWKPGVVGFIPLTNQSFYERRSSLGGITLRATTLKVNWTSDVLIDNKNIYKCFIPLWDDTIPILVIKSEKMSVVLCGSINNRITLDRKLIVIGIFVDLYLN